MKKKALAAALASVILLSGCSGDGSTPAEQTPTPQEPSSSANAPSGTEAAGMSNSKEEGTENMGPDAPISEEEKYADAPAPVFASNTMPEDYSTEAVGFQTEIDEFYKQFKEKPIPSGEQSTYDHWVQSGYSVRKLEIDGTHLYEVKIDDGEPKALVILIHAGFGQKDLNEAAEMAWAAELSGQHVCVAAIDVSGCGESRDGPVQAPAAFMETVKDIDTLIEYYNTVPDVDASSFGLTGFSLGGNISMYYVVYGKYKPAAICISGACPDPFTDRGPVWDCMDKGENGQPSVWDGDQMTAFVTAIRPINHPELFTDIWVYSCIGELDEDNPPERMESLKNAVETLGGEKFIYRCYEGMGHEQPQSWRDNETKEFFSKLR